MGKKKDKKENAYLDKLLEQVEMQGLRINELVSKFYPDGILAKFVSLPQVVEYVMNRPTLQCFSDDKAMSDRYSDINIASYDEAFGSVDIPFGSYYYNFNGFTCVKFTAYAMFKEASDAAIIYLKDGLLPGKVKLEFLVDGNRKEAYLVVADENKPGDSGHSFIKLSEFHAILYRPKLEPDKPDVSSNELCFTVSFSQEKGTYSSERIYDMNMCNPHLQTLLMSGNPGEPNNGEDDGKETEADNE